MSKSDQSEIQAYTSLFALLKWKIQFCNWISDSFWKDFSTRSSQLLNETLKRESCTGTHPSDLPGPRGAEPGGCHLTSCCTEPSWETTAHSHVVSFTNPPSTFPQQVLRVHTCSCSTKHIPWLYCQEKENGKTKNKSSVIPCDTLQLSCKTVLTNWIFKTAAALLFNRLQLLTHRNLWSSLTATILSCL